MKKTLEKMPETPAPKAATKFVARPERTAYTRLRTWNKWLAFAYAAQAIALIIASITKTVPVTLSHLTTNTLASETAGHPVLATAVRHLFDINLAYLLATVLLIGAVLHGLMATRLRRQYEAGVQNGVNKLRWIGTSTAGNLATVAVALLCGVSDLPVLLAIFGFGLLASAMAYGIEQRSQGADQPGLLMRLAAIVAASTPWILITLYVLASAAWGTGVPAYVYAAYGVALAAFILFASNLYLAARKKGKWAEYAYAELVCIAVAAVGASALVWTVFAGTLRP